MGVQALEGGGMRGGGSTGEESEHGGTEVDGIGLEVWVGGEEARGEAAIAVAEDERAPSVHQCGQKVVAAC
jgi:hypothetical protein